MIMTQRLIQCRMEHKYVLWSGEVVRFLARLGPVLSDSRFRRDHGWITTVYFDRPDGHLTRKVLACPSRCLKLRLREYFTAEGVPSSPFVWIEIKERDGATSRKSRFQLHKRLVARFLRSDVGDAEILACQGPMADPYKVLGEIRRVRDISDDRELVPVGAVAYRRLALEGGDPVSRLTLDQEVSYHRGPFALYESNPSLERERLGSATHEEKAAIVELKVRGPTSPSWCDAPLRTARPAEYSKFQVLSALSVSERPVD